jgi:hypothetical protein
MSETLQIRPVRREAAKLVIGLAATSGEGKTYSALLLAKGLAGGDPRKIGLLDTENQRGSLYSDIFGTKDKDRFLIGDLAPPFSPTRYVAAMREFAASGVEALVIDSMSHEWEGEGGCEEIAHNPNKKIADWLTAKREHKRFMNALLFLPCHIVACFRAREKTSFKDPKNPVSLGLQPITEKNVLFEMSASFILRNQGRERDIIKLPECLAPILGGNGYLTEEHGKKLREWVGGSDPVERVKNQLRLAASQGMDALRDAFTAIDPATRKQVSAFKDTLKELAAHADAERAKPDDGKPDESQTGGPEIPW